MPVEKFTHPIISLWQPWAAWVALGWKPIETRTHKRFAGLKGQTIGIHAASRWDDSAIEAAERWLNLHQWKLTTLGKDDPKSIFGARSAVLATAHVQDFTRLIYGVNCKDAMIECETERWGLHLNDLRRLDPVIYAPGKQGIWYIDREGSLFK